MNRVDFIDWLHTEIDAVLYGEQSKEQLLLKAIPMVDLMLQKCEQAHVVGRSKQLVCDYCGKDKEEGLDHCKCYNGTAWTKKAN